MNPFAQIQNAAHARALASAFVVVHPTGRDQSAIEDQLYAALRMARRMSGERVSAYLDGYHFLEWQTPAQEFDANWETVTELQALAHEFLDGQGSAA